MDDESRKRQIPMIDEFVDLGTHKLHIVLSDAPSEHTVVLEAGGGKDSDSYREIQVALAKRAGTRVMSYDRSGFGQSELGPGSFNAVDEVKALKRCLDAKGLKDKLILAGLSYGGFLAQLFTELYPDAVSGLVLVDPMNFLFVDRFGLDNLNAVTPYFDEPTEKSQKAGNRMVDHSKENFEAMRGKELPRQKPVTLISSGHPPMAKDLWRRCHEEMTAHSPNHRLLVAEDNNHDIVEENPELVLNVIIDMIGRVAAERA